MQATTEELYDASQRRDKNGRWTSGGAGASAQETRFPNGANPNTVAARASVALDQRVQAMSRYPADPEDLINYERHRAAAVAYVQRMVGTNPDVRIRLDVNTLERVIEDGRFKTQHETGTSKGSFAPDTRDSHEKAMFDVDQPRPIYGYVSSDTIRDSGANRYVTGYGSIAVVLKPEVAARATMTVGDSLYLGRAIAPIPVNDVATADPRRIEVAITEARPIDYVGGSVYSEAALADPARQQTLYGPTYFEAQIHGGVKVSDIDRVVVPLRDGATMDRIQNMLAGTGIPIETASSLLEYGTETPPVSDFFHTSTIHTFGLISTDVEEFFNPSQPRDKNGRWTTGGRGSDVAGAPRKKATGKESKADGEVKHTPTEFGAKIRKMIEDDPVLAGRPTLADIDSWIASDKAAAETSASRRLEQVLRNPYKWEISAYPVGDYSREARNEATEKVREMREVVDKSVGKFMDNPDAPANGPFEEMIQKEIKARLSGKPQDSVGQVMNIDVEIPGSGQATVRLSVRTPKVIPRATDPSKMMEDSIDGAYLDSAQKVGRVVREEIVTRTQDKVYAKVAEYDRAVSEIEALGVDLGKISTYHSGGSWKVIGKTKDGQPLTPDVEERLSKLILENPAARLGLGVSRESMALAAAVNAKQEAYREVMQEIMPMGGVVAGTPRHKASTRTSQLSSHEQAVSAASRYPATWVELSGRVGSVEFKKTSARAHYAHNGSNGNGTITLDGRISTAVHELGHRFERSVPGLYALERQFHSRRTAGESPVRLQSIFPGHRYGRDEITYEDDFYHAYAGKVYDNSRALEVFTVGMEGTSMFTGGGGTKGVRMIDADHEAFILGSLVTLVKP